MWSLRYSRRVTILSNTLLACHIFFARFGQFFRERAKVLARARARALLQGASVPPLTSSPLSTLLITAVIDGLRRSWSCILHSKSTLHTSNWPFCHSRYSVPVAEYITHQPPLDFVYRGLFLAAGLHMRSTGTVKDLRSLSIILSHYDYARVCSNTLVYGMCAPS